MSVLIGIVKRDGSAVTSDELSPLYESIHSIPHRCYHKTLLNCAAFGVLATEDYLLPFFSESENLLFAAQGSIYNRDELGLLLGIDKVRLDTLSDESLIFETYLQYRDEAPSRLIGEWSFVAYDYTANRFFTAQDPCGATSLYYYVDSEIIIFSNLLKPLLKSPYVPKKLDMGKILERELILHMVDHGATMFESIKILGLAHCMSIDALKHQKWQYWFPETLPLRGNVKFEDAVAELKGLFTEAVRCRIQKYKPIASMLSGGLDSGSVCVVAAQLLKNQGTKLHTFSHVPLFDIDDNAIKKHRFGNERQNIEETVTHSGNIIPNFLDSATISPLQGIRIALDLSSDIVPATGNIYWFMDILQQTKKQGFETLLNGQAGNTTISYTGLDYALSTDRLMKIYGLKKGLKHKWYRPLRHGIISQVIKLFSHDEKWKSYSYISSAYAKRINVENLTRRIGRVGDVSHMLFNAQEFKLNLLKIGYAPQPTTGASFGHYFGIKYLDPTADSRIVEFILQMPNEIFFSESGENKQLLRHMMKGLLPDKVLLEKKIGLQSADIIDRIQSDIPEIESIVTSFKTDLIDEDFFDKSKILEDLQLLKEKKLSFEQTSFLLRTVGTMEFLNHHQKFIRK